MSQPSVNNPTEIESRKVAEASRQDKWEKPSFLRDLFLGTFRLDLVHPWPRSAEERPEFTAFYGAMREFLRDRGRFDGDRPHRRVPGARGRRAAQARRLRHEDSRRSTAASASPTSSTSKVMELLGSFDGNLTALLSAHQSIGVPQPLKLFGTEEQKKKYLPRCAAGEISAFALTEPDVGSDPARLATTAELTPEGDAYILNGEKLWCTNGTLAELLVVMARDPKTKKISAFVVETDWPGVKVEHRCRFMGLKALANGVISLHRRARAAREPDRRRGQGSEDRAHHPQHRPAVDSRRLRWAPPSSASRSCREWASTRVQWGRPIGQARGDRRTRSPTWPATTFAMESMAELASRDGRPRRLRHPPRGRGGEGVEHRSGLADRRRHPADPRRARLRDRAIRCVAAARRRFRSSGSCATTASTASSRARARSCTCSWPARRSTSTCRWPAP